MGAGITALALGAQGCSDDETVVEIATGEPPTLLAFRAQGEAAWRALPVQGQTTFEISVDGPYEVVIVCERTGARALLSAVRYARTPEDDAFIDHGCRNSPRPFTVRGQVVQPGEAAFAESARGTAAANWPFAFGTYPGTFELLLWKGDLNDGLESIAIRRGIAVSGDLDFGTIDLTREAMHPLVPVSFTATNLLPKESKWAYVLLDTGGTSAPPFLPFDAEWNALLAPECALQAADRQVIQLSAITGSETSSQYARAVTISARVGGATSAVLPEPIGSAAFEKSPGRLAATWATLPAHEELFLHWDSFNDDFDRAWLYTARISRSYLEATGGTSAALDFRDVPGFALEWQQDPEREQFLTLTAGAGKYDEEGGKFSIFEEYISRAPRAAGEEPRATSTPALRELRRELQEEELPMRPYLLRVR
jgi:hypothetical protein